ncbi:hypothetical protein THIX_60669 [Thiomonas sp. X19]|nr:hypothetical protein THIX_60669 [Thiomonas sp. X19]
MKAGKEAEKAAFIGSLWAFSMAHSRDARYFNNLLDRHHVQSTAEKLLEQCATVHKTYFFTHIAFNIQSWLLLQARCHSRPACSACGLVT